MFEKFTAMLDESELACSLAMGLSIAAAVLLSIAAIAALVGAFLVSLWWILGTVAFGLADVAVLGLVVYLSGEYYS